MEAVKELKEDREQDSTNLLDSLLLHQHCVLSLCLGYARDPAQAEELAQEAYLKALKNASGLRDAGAAKVWLCRIAKHTCLDELKRERLGREALSRANPRVVEDRTPEALAVGRGELRLIKQAVRRLPRRLRDVFVLREYAELAYDEIAEALGCRRGTVMSRLNRARRRLAGLLTERKNGT